MAELFPKSTNQLRLIYFRVSTRKANFCQAKSFPPLDCICDRFADCSCSESFALNSSSKHYENLKHSFYLPQLCWGRVLRRPLPNQCRLGQKFLVWSRKLRAVCSGVVFIQLRELWTARKSFKACSMLRGQCLVSRRASDFLTKRTASEYQPTCAPEDLTLALTSKLFETIGFYQTHSLSKNALKLTFCLRHVNLRRKSYCRLSLSSTSNSKFQMRASSHFHRPDPSPSIKETATNCYYFPCCFSNYPSKLAHCMSFDDPATKFSNSRISLWSYSFSALCFVVCLKTLQPRSCKNQFCH